MKNNIMFKPTVILQLQKALRDESQTEPLQGRDCERGAMAQTYPFCRRARLYGGAGKDSDDRRLITAFSLWNKLWNFNQMELTGKNLAFMHQTSRSQEKGRFLLKKKNTGEKIWWSRITIELSHKKQKWKEFLEKDVLVGLSKGMTTGRIEMNYTLKNFYSCIEYFPK